MEGRKLKESGAYKFKITLILGLLKNAVGSPTKDCFIKEPACLLPYPDPRCG